MSKKAEPKRQSPSVIARLMGLEALPSPKRQQRRSVDSHQNDGSLTRRNYKENMEFKDVYEDLEAAHIANRCFSSKYNAKSIFVDPGVAHIHDKFKEAKHLSAVEKDFWVQFLHQPGSTSVKHVHDPQLDQSSSLGSYVAILKPSNSEIYEGKPKPLRSARCTSTGHDVISQMKRQDGLLLEPHNQRGVHTCWMPRKTLLNATRIVVLKPNLGKTQNACTSSSSPVCSHLCPNRIRKMVEHKSIGGSDRVSRRRKDSFDKEGSSMPMSKEAREIAREITRKMRYCANETMTTRSNGLIGYAGDESSCEPDSESETEAFTLSSIKSFDDANFNRYSSTLVKSFTNKEAKKRLSERWKITQKYQDLEMFSKGSTLGEMLALPDGDDARPNHFHNKGVTEVSNQLFGSKETAIRTGPLGISSRDGWTNAAARVSSRSRPHHPSLGGSHNKRTDCYEFREGRDLMYGNSYHCSRSKSVRGKSSLQEDFSSDISRSRGKMSRSRSQMFDDETWSSSEASVGTPMAVNTKDIMEDQPSREADSRTDTCEHPIFDVMSGELESALLSLRSSNLLPEDPRSVVDVENSAVLDQEDFGYQDLKKGNPNRTSPSLHPLGAEPESSGSSKGADHPSPVSVLEVPFVEDEPSSESFERVNADLHELRMQLQLLKMESGTFEELYTLEEEAEQISPASSERNHTQKFAAENWEIAYALDVLIESGLQESNFDMFQTNWYSRDCPLDLNLFDKLEKKYNNEMGGSKSERRLLFDRINSELLHIFHAHVDLYPWVIAKLSGSHLKSENEIIRDAVDKLINRNFSNREITGIVLDQEMQWLKLKGEINIIGDEVARLLLDDMITDLICK